MKKFVIVWSLLLLFLTFLFGAELYAGWTIVTSEWSQSVGPDLAYEQVLMDDVVIPGCDNILPSAPKTCSTCVETKTGQIITIRSYDTSGNYADNTIGNIGIGPNPSQGGSVTVIWSSTACP